MYDTNNMPGRTQMSHYLRTGRVLPAEYFEERKSLKGLSREQIILGISKALREPGRTLFFHYFKRRGQTFDLVANGLLQEPVFSGKLATYFSGRLNVIYCGKLIGFVTGLRKTILWAGQKPSSDFRRNFLTGGL